MKSDRYQAIRCRLLLWGVPQYRVDALNMKLGDTPDFKSQLEEIGIHSGVTSIKLAQRQTHKRLRECQRQVKSRNYTALLELVDIEPGFLFHPWVMKQLTIHHDDSRLMRKPGRPQGTRKFHPLALRGLVDSLIEGKKVPNKSVAFDRIEEWGLLGVGHAKRLYQQTVSGPPVCLLIEYGESPEWVSREQALGRSELIGPNSTTSREVETDRDLMEVRVTTGDAPLGNVNEFAVFDRVTLIHTKKAS